MRVRLLGPVDVMSAGEVRPVSGLRRKAVLATLALQAGQVVSTGRLVDAVWGESAPAALNTLQSHVSYLRTVVGKAAIAARPPGYLLDLGDDGTDVQLAERLLHQGVQSADPGRWLTWPGWPGWNSRRGGWICSVSRSGTRCPRRGWPPGNTGSWYRNSSRGRPITRSTSRSTPS